MLSYKYLIEFWKTAEHEDSSINIYFLSQPSTVTGAFLWDVIFYYSLCESLNI